MDGSTDQHNKSHNARSKGAKAAKQELHRKQRRGLDTEPNRGQNPRAFTTAGPDSRKMKAASRTMEKRENHFHVPTSDKTLGHLHEDPPLLVAVVGPPRCGKSTLIRSLVRFYCNRNIQKLSGPVTVVAGRARRITFVETPNTLSAMCDVAKVADLVLLMVDGSYGFEMETFEFLNISQVHGFAKIIGVVSHLDKLKSTKQLKKSKKMMRHRFWHEVSPGAKLLCLSPMVQGSYRSSDVLKLHRLLVTVETKPQAWRNTHSCVYLDRHEDITAAEDVEAEPNCNRTVAMYGYVRGHPVKPGQMMHVPGVGDLRVKHISRQDDPCQPVESNATSQGSKMRHLSTKHKRVYAPYCDIGGVMFDSDAVYVYTDKELDGVERTGEGVDMLRELQRAGPLEDQLEQNDLAAVEGRRPVEFANDDTMDIDVDVEDGSEAESDSGSDSDVNDEARAGRPHDPLAAFGFGDDADEAAGDVADDDEEELAPRHPFEPDTCIVAKAGRFDWSDPEYQQKLKAFFVTGAWTAEERGEDADGDADSRGYESVDEADEGHAAGPADDDDDDEEAMEGTDEDDEADDEDDEAGSEEDEDEGEFDDDDAALPALLRSSDDGAVARKKQTAPHAAQPPAAELVLGEDGVEQGADVQGLLDFFIARDLEKDGEDLLQADIADEEPEADPDAVTADTKLTEEQESYMKKKLAKKQEFDEGYDASGGKNNTTKYYQHLLEEEATKRKRLDETLEVVGEDIDKRISLVGFFSGLYVRIVFEDIPVEFLRNFDPAAPLFAGGLNAGEDQMGFVNARMKRHRWYPRIHKAQDPVIMSVGWRRIQTQPIFASEDANGRLRYLKYTPKHMHCVASFYAPSVPPNTGFALLPATNARSPHFRLTATGYTMGVDANASIVKKLKLTGTPDKIQKTTCFVRGMFNTDVEAAKFVGAKVKAVSGVRGMVKKVLKGKNGLVRCTFEDKLLVSDIVFLRAWKPVDPPTYCQPVRDRMVPKGATWQGMKTMAQIRRERGLRVPQRPDSEYKEVVRRVRPEREAPVQMALSRNMRVNLPFDMKEEYVQVQRSSKNMRRVEAATTTAPEPREAKRAALLQQFRDKAQHLTDVKQKQRKAVRVKQARDHEKDVEEQQRKLKKAKKETAKRADFRNQKKNRD